MQDKPFCRVKIGSGVSLLPRMNFESRESRFMVAEDGMLNIYFYLIQDDYGSYIANISPDMSYSPDDMLKML